MYIDMSLQKEMVGLGTRPLGEGSTFTEMLMGREGDTLLGCAFNRGPPSGAPVKRATTSQRRTKGSAARKTRGAPQKPEGAHPKSAGMMQNVGTGMLGALELAGGPRGECT